MEETDAMLYAFTRYAARLRAHPFPARRQFSMNTAICSPESSAHIRLSPSSPKIEVAGYAYGSNGTSFP